MHSEDSENDQFTGNEIAIVGMAARLPGALSVRQYWENLRDGVESVRRFSTDELEKAGVPKEVYSGSYAPFGAVLDEFDEFDAPFFSFSPRDAALLDPQFRQFLECGWEAIEAAGYDPGDAPGAVGVFAGVGQNAYNLFNLYSNPDLVHSVGEFHIRHVGNDKDFLTTRLSFHLNLKGPSVNVQTACSTSLVAVHLGCQSLLGGECDMAVAGAVSLMVPQTKGAPFAEGGIIAPDGHCRAFVAESAGTVFGSGVALVVLKRLKDALDDGDPIRAVIKGSAINNDGSLKAGYMAPSVDAQSQVIAEALDLAELDADSVTYVAAHGTGTPVGDPIEIAALTQAFRKTTDETQFCAIGSVKTNIGHLDTAAGTASLIAAAQALENEAIPPCVHFESPNPSIPFESTPFFVNAELQPWPRTGQPRRAGVSSLGVGGTNAHVVLEEAPEREASGPSRANQLFLLSARTPASLDRATSRLAEHLRSDEGASESLADVAYTLQVGRHEFGHRRIVVGGLEDREGVAEALDSVDPERVFSGYVPEEERSVVFQFPGGGAQYPNMAKDLYATERVFQEAVDECLAILKSKESLDLFSLLYSSEAELENARGEIQKPSLALPLLFTIEYSLAKLWTSWGVAPKAMIGHSMGEYTAACLAGVFPLETALSLVTLRGRLFEKLPEGGMTSVPLAHDEVSKRMPEGLSFAAINGPGLCVASGPVEKLEELERSLTESGDEFQRLKISVAAHSAMLEPILEEFRSFLVTVEFSAPELPFVSNVTGAWITAEEATSAEYWVRHLRETVRYSDGLRTILEDPARILVEIGPGRVLTSLAGMHPSKTTSTAVVSSLRHPKEDVCDQALLLDRLARVWLAGGQIDWQGFYESETRHRVLLPTYSFDHERYWVEPGDHLLTRGSGANAGFGGLARKADVADWFSSTSWRREALSVASTDDEMERATERCLVIAESESFGDRLTSALRDRGHDVTRASLGEDFEALLDRLGKENRTPTRIIHAGAVGVPPELGRAVEELDDGVQRGFQSLFSLGHALGSAGFDGDVGLIVLASHSQQLSENESVSPVASLVNGPCRILSAEVVSVRSCAIDIVEPSPGSWKERRLFDQLVREIERLPEDATPAIAYRGDERWVESFEDRPVPADSPAEVDSKIRQGGVYLITGGLGGIGSVLAEHLASRYQARLILTSRDKIPKESERDDWLSIHGADDETSRRIARIRRLEQLGAEVVVLRADVTSIEDMNAVVNAAEKRFHGLDGVFHAAGVLDDGLLQMKTAEDCERVLSPKVRGTLVLDRVLDGVELDFVVLFSSISAFAGLAGQFDYAAANSFLDAYAREACRRSDRLTIAVNWSAWADVGMLADADVSAGAEGTSSDTVIAHPMLESMATTAEGYRTYRSTWSADRDWFLDEHRNTDGTAFLPGTAYLELSRAVGVDSLSHASVEIRDAVFLAPLVLRGDEERDIEARVQISADSASGEVGVFSRASGKLGAWDEHYRARLSRCEASAAGARSVSVDEISARCETRNVARSGESLRLEQEKHLDFGPRWRVLQEIRLGENEGIATLELPEEFAKDLESFGLPPAMLDMATAFGLPLLEGYGEAEGFYVPLSYDRVQVLGAIGREVRSHVRSRSDRGAGGSMAVFDIDVVDAQGGCLARIEGFSMVRVERIAQDESSVDGAGASKPGSDTAGSVLEESMIDPRSGIEALERILRFELAPQVAVSTCDLTGLLRALREEAGVASSAVEASGVAGLSSKRPDLSSPFVAAETETQKSIVEIWEEALGIEEVGVHDNFFELGGHSLLLTQMLSRIRGLGNASITLRTLFEKPTVASLAEVFGDNGEEVAASSASSIKRVSRDRYRVSRPTLGSE